jgi:protein-S-isoprenylcysteine O-methyltransferase Ste14
MTIATTSMLARERNSVAEWLLRAVAIASYIYTLSGMWVNWTDNARPYGLLMLMLTEVFTLGLIVIARQAVRRDASLLAMLATIYSSCFFVLLEISDTVHLIPDWTGAALQLGGLGLALAAKVVLGRAFGILPAARGLVTAGPYRVVRHPMYLGYTISSAGFLLTNASLRNALVMAALLLVQLLRILREEEVLKRSNFAPSFADYCARVRCRILPFVF